MKRFLYPNVTGIKKLSLITFFMSIGERFYSARQDLSVLNNGANKLVPYVKKIVTVDEVF